MRRWNWMGGGPPRGARHNAAAAGAAGAEGAGATGSGGRGEAGAGQAAGASDRADWVPPGRLREETTARTTAEGRATAAEARATTLERRNQAFVGLGVADPEAADLAIASYDRLPEQGRPAFDAHVAALKSAPPKWLGAYLPAAGGQAAGAAQGQVATTAGGQAAAGQTGAAQNGTGTGTAGSTVAAGAGGGAGQPTVTAQHVAELRARARQTGDYTALKAAMPTIEAAVSAKFGR